MILPGWRGLPEPERCASFPNIAMNPEDQLPPLYDETPHSHWRIPLAAAALLVVAALLGMRWLAPEHPSQPAPPLEIPPLDDQARAYLDSVEIAGLTPSKWSNLLDQEVIYLDGNVSNRGDRTVRALELTIVFYNIDGEVVRRDTFRPVGSVFSPAATGRTAPLSPGQARDFRAAFENVPVSWNQRTPRVQITGLLLAGPEPETNP